MKALYLDCISGISGDMTVGALVDLGVRPSTLEWELSKLPIGEFHMHFDRAKRKEIEGVRFTIHEGAVHRPEQDEHEEAHSHSHDHHHHHHEEEHGHHEHEHEHGEDNHHHHHHHQHEHESGECCDHDHGDELEHAHEECSGHEHGYEYEHRAYADIRTMLKGSELSPFVKEHALGIFRRIAVAEGKIHGKSPDDVHFHEVGAFDSIADIVMACVGFESLGVTKIFASTLHDGHGTVECAHGTFPVPAPATLEILRGIPLGQIDEPHELITPTGAAIVVEFAESFGPMPTLKIEKIGYGLGKRDLATRPNVLRAVLGELTA
jgi:pyridinium-3,5-bisthiocarboxylic acid mononucleotide nickel chelatase